MIYKNTSLLPVTRTRNSHYLLCVYNKAVSIVACEKQFRRKCGQLRITSIFVFSLEQYETVDFRDIIVVLVGSLWQQYLAEWKRTEHRAGFFGSQKSLGQQDF